MKESERRRAILGRLAGMQGALLPPRTIPTGFSSLNAALGGGVPRGRIAEFFGPAGCGKTTLALQIIAHLQRSGLNAAFLDAEQTFDAAWAASLGVRIEGLPLAQPRTAEQTLDIARTLAASGAIDLVVIDSAAALAPRLEVESGMMESIPRLQSRVLGNELRKLSSAIRRSDTAVLFLNQMRNRAGQTSGEMETSAGGPPLKLFAAIRIVLLPSGGSRLRLRVLKNSVAEGAGGGELEWRRGGGFLSECP
jgi:recombination protein RecA